MSIINLFGSKKNKTTPEYFLAVEIHDSLIKSVSWQILDGEPHIVRLGSFELWSNEESLINGVDASITEAAKNLEPAPRKVILGLPDSWMTDGNDIHPSKKHHVYRVIKELNLEAMGMVPTTQALIHYLKKKEGIPPTAIILEVFSTKVVVSIVKLGKVEASEEVGLSGDLPRDVEEGLARMDYDNLPSRFILTDGTDLENEEQQLISFPWKEKLPFRHLPKVEVLPIDFSIKAVAWAGGLEAMVHQSGIDISDPVTVQDTDSNLSIPTKSPPSALADLGFSYEETLPPTEVSDTLPLTEEDEIIEGDDEVSAIDIPDETATTDFAIPEEDLSPRKSMPKRKVLAILPKISLKNKIHFSFPKLSASRFVPIIVILLLLIPVGAIFAYFSFFVKTEVDIVVVPQKTSKVVNLSIAESKQSDLPTLIAYRKTVSGKAQESLPTTGEATVGERSTGTITIFNRAATPLSLKSGISISSDTGTQNFILSEAILVASKSADLLSGSEVFGKKEGAKVAAVKIGAEYNLSKNTSFTVDNYSKSLAYAIADSDFSGGTSRVVRAVDRADLDKLTSQAIEKIKSQVQQELSQNDPDVQSIQLGDIVFDQKKFDHKEKDGAATVSLDMSGSINLLVYSKRDLDQLVADSVKNELSPGMKISSVGTVTKIGTPEKKSDGVYITSATVDAALIPQLDTDLLASNFRGKPLSLVRSLAQATPNYKSTTVRFMSRLTEILPFLNNLFVPFGPITVNIINQ